MLSTPLGITSLIASQPMAATPRALSQGPIDALIPAVASSVHSDRDVLSYASAGKSSSALKHRGGQQDAQKFVPQWAERIARQFRGRLAHRPHCPNEAPPEMSRPDLKLQ